MADPVTLMVLSTALTAGGELAKGTAADKQAKYEGTQLDRAAKSKYATGTREAAEELRTGRIAESDAIARMAASGGTATDAAAIERLAKIQEASKHEALSSLYARGTEAQGLRHKAAARRYEGKLKKQQAKMKALTTVISGGSKAYKSFKGGNSDWVNPDTGRKWGTR